MSLGSNDNIPYGAPDFERYYSGGMTAEEMHALEKAALEDPFLADALEGYKAARSPVADTAWLREQLAGKTQQRKVVPMAPKKSYPFLRIAALVLLLLGAGWSVYYLADSRKGTLALEQKEERSAPAPQPPAPVTAQDSAPEQTLTLEDKSAPADIKPAAPPRRPAVAIRAPKKEEPRAVAAAAPVTEAREADQERPMLLREKEGNDVAAVERKQTVPQALQGRAAGVELNKDSHTQGQDTRIRIRGASTLNTFRGRVVDPNNQGVANATVSLRNNRTAVATDGEGYFTLNAPDTAVKANIAALGFQTQNVTLNRQQGANQIILQQNSEALSEVVVTGYGTQRKRAATGAISNALPQPTEGWSQFEAYVQTNRKPSGSLSPQGLKGSVSLSFAVTRKGTPTDIKVDSSLSAEYDQEAIRLLRQGPKWSRVKGTRGKVTILFP